MLIGKIIARMLEEAEARECVLSSEAQKRLDECTEILKWVKINDPDVSEIGKEIDGTGVSLLIRCEVGWGGCNQRKIALIELMKRADLVGMDAYGEGGVEVLIKINSAN